MDFYIFVVGLLFILAISDLMVGVANDAVNFTNSAIGSKAASRTVIMIIASLGIIVGTTFSGGMMEVARKGIFNPEAFLFPEIMVIFLAVMFTDVLLLDLFNTFGLPTSTTVSMVFELLGAAIAIASVKLFSLGLDFSSIGIYINSDKVVAIITAIPMSVIIAFTAGVIAQFITRIIFTFKYKNTFKKVGALWGATGITLILYFILLKGLKGSTLLSPESIDWIGKNTFSIVGCSFAALTVILFFVIRFTRINMLRIIVLIGTFALALGFASNDLVNFVGVPMAGFHAYLTALSNANPMTLMMTALSKPIQPQSFILISAGLVMITTLWFSRKARTVTDTEVELARQGKAKEKFGKSRVAASIVEFAMFGINLGRKPFPAAMQTWVGKRFKTKSFFKKADKKNTPAFDLLRASVNLVVASTLIAIGTSYKLPLSTTYVTFMVAMGTSLSDRAWGSESAVARVNGILTVIGGWFFTALIASALAAIQALIIYFGGLTAIIILVILSVFFVYRTHLLHKQRTKNDDPSKAVG